MNKHATVTRRISSYFTSIAFKQLSNVLVTLLRPKLLSPELFGLYSMLKTILGYAAFAPLGARQGVRIRVPMLLGQGNYAEANTIQNALFYGTIFPNLLFLCIAALISLPYTNTPVEYTALGTLGVLVACNWYYEYILTVLKAHQRFEVISKANYYSVLFSYGSLALLFLFGIYGLFAAMVLSQIGISLIMRSGSKSGERLRDTSQNTSQATSRNPSPNPHTYPSEKSAFHAPEQTTHTQQDPSGFRFSQYIELVRFGFPIMSLGLVVLVIRTMDRLIITGMLGLKEVGFYSIACMALNFLLNLPTVSREVIEPMLMESLSSMTEQERFSTYLFIPLFHYIYLFPFVVASACFLTPLVLPLILPEYTQSILSTQILIAGSFFLGLTYVVRGIIIAEKWQNKAVRVACIAVVANGLLSSLAIITGAGIAGVGLASSVSFLVLFAGLMHVIRTSAAATYGPTIGAPNETSDHDAKEGGIKEKTEKAATEYDPKMGGVFKRFTHALAQCVTLLFVSVIVAILLVQTGSDPWVVYLTAYGLYSLLAFTLFRMGTAKHPELAGVTLTGLFKKIA